MTDRIIVTLLGLVAASNKPATFIQTDGRCQVELLDGQDFRIHSKYLNLDGGGVSTFSGVNPFSTYSDYQCNTASDAAAFANPYFRSRHTSLEDVMAWCDALPGCAGFQEEDPKGCAGYPQYSLFKHQCSDQFTKASLGDEVLGLGNLYVRVHPEAVEVPGNLHEACPYQLGATLTLKTRFDE